MKAKVSRLLARVEKLGIGRPHEYISLFENITDTICTFWTQEEKALHHQRHPGPGILLGCPKEDQSEWLGLGTGPDDGGDWEELLKECLERIERCRTCEYGVPSEKETT